RPPHSAGDRSGSRPTAPAPPCAPLPARDPHEVAHVGEPLYVVDGADDRVDVPPRQDAPGPDPELLLDREVVDAGLRALEHPPVPKLHARGGPEHPLGE